LTSTGPTSTASPSDDAPILDDGPIVPTAPPRRPARTRYVVLGVACVVALGFLLYKGLTDSAVYYRTVTESIERRADGDTDRFRMAGDVVPGSVVETDDGVSFTMTDGASTAEVLHEGSPPELFADGVPVVVEGRWDDQVFHSDEILIRHDNEYDPQDNGYEPSEAVTDGTGASSAGGAPTGTAGG
jgi:cytochrome c-type biogenesis protein CcmE